MMWVCIITMLFEGSIYGGGGAYNTAVNGRLRSGAMTSISELKSKKECQTIGDAAVRDNPGTRVDYLCIKVR